MNAWTPASTSTWPAGESAHASAVDLLFIGLVATSALVLLLLFFLLLRFAIHYRAGNKSADRDHRTKKGWHWEVAWTAATLVAFLGLFVWGAQLFLELGATGKNALPVYVTAQQWMWKAQHLGGQREINELHVPLGHTIRLIMSSQDVIHSFFMPAFRIKRDVVPGVAAELSFRPLRAGVYHLFCAEYCGTDHARMTGRIVVMEEAEFSTWLARQDLTGTLAEAGAQSYRDLGCGGCHGAGGTVRAPPLEGLYGRPVPLSDGTIVVADEAYLRDAILKPRAQIVAGYDPLMPSYQGKISEDELIGIVAYIKSLAVGTVPR
jgi:cytochrome c oxidase subunit 2